MNLKFNYNHIIIILFSFFFFFWGVDLERIKLSYFLAPEYEFYELLSNIRLSYFIVLLLIPITYSCVKKKTLLFKQIFNYQKYILLLTLFIIIHLFFVKFYYNESVDKSEIANLFYLIILSVIYCHYRDFIFVNFKKIIILYLIIFVLFSITKLPPIYNEGQCNNDIFIINLIREYLKISLTRSIYLENSHLAMMSVAVFFSSIFLLLQQKRNNLLFLLFLISVEIIIILNNLSTTYFVAYFFSVIALLLFLVKKINNTKYWIITVLFLFINSYLFLSDKQCTAKIIQFDVQELITDDINKNDKNLTTTIYQRSIIVSKRTLLHQPLGWGIDGMDNATQDLLKEYRLRVLSKNFINKFKGAPIIDENIVYWHLNFLNLKDGLSNFFKLFTEFGIFAFIIYFYFIKYLLNLKNINSYNLFIIVLFITLSIRGAGYFNGGFIFCLLEFFYHKKFNNNQ